MMYTGILRKMRVLQSDEVRYFLKVEEDLEISAMLGNKVHLQWTGRIYCQSCGKQTKKSFGEGFCYTCFVGAPEAAECIIRPELCRAHLGQGRDVAWENKNHNVPHVVYLAASDTIKVGVTRQTQIPTRWIDQGASSAIVLAITPNRYEAGVLEVALKSLYTDKTNWRRMLKNELDSSIDLVNDKWSVYEQLPSDLKVYFSENDDIIQFSYPVLNYPSNVSSLSLEKTSEVVETLAGIKGQYMIFRDGSVFNVRRHTGYEVNLSLQV